MGDWFENPDPTSPDPWLYDENAPTPITRADYDPSATRVDLPAVGGRVTYDEHVDYVTTSDDDVAERIDGWCEDRPPDQLSDDDGRD